MVYNHLRRCLVEVSHKFYTGAYSTGGGAAGGLNYKRFFSEGEVADLKGIGVGSKTFCCNIEFFFNSESVTPQ